MPPKRTSTASTASTFIAYLFSSSFVFLPLSHLNSQIKFKMFRSNTPTPFPPSLASAPITHAHTHARTHTHTHKDTQSDTAHCVDDKENNVCGVRQRPKASACPLRIRVSLSDCYPETLPLFQLSQRMTAKTEKTVC